MLRKLLLIALAGALGTLARYGLAGLTQRLTNAYLPWGTFAVNVLGCFAAGVLWALLENRWAVSGETRTIVLVGFLGAFTTFSAWILETGELVRATEWGYAALNLALHVVLGFAALYVGINLGRVAP
ncbi:MAG: chromosome condensation protein CrcB [candidate division Zixibacteria bacterium]|nr:chromosome condensation protein CrcB [candidate division Zixibacteria bacterium]